MHLVWLLHLQEQLDYCPCGQQESIEQEYCYIFAICVALQFYFKNDGTASGTVSCYAENRINKGDCSAL